MSIDRVGAFTDRSRPSCSASSWSRFSYVSRSGTEAAVLAGVGEAVLVVVGQGEQRFGAVAVVRRAVHDRQRFGL